MEAAYLRPGSKVSNTAEELQGVGLLRQGIGGSSNSPVRFVDAPKHLKGTNHKKKKEGSDSESVVGWGESFLTKEAGRKNGWPKNRSSWYMSEGSGHDRVVDCGERIRRLKNMLAREPKQLVHDVSKGSRIKKHTAVVANPQHVS